MTRREQRYANPKLKTNVGGVELDNPLMVAAGWDKFGDSVKGLHALGFGAVEVGTVPHDAQSGNPRSRHFVVAPGVMVNRYGFNTPGAAVIKDNLRRYAKTGIPLGINIGKNKEVPLEEAPQAHADVAHLLYEEASYFALGVSSPNTVGVREQQAKHVLTGIAQAVQAAVKAKGGGKPVFVKTGPDLSMPQIDDVLGVVADTGLAGVIAANTTASESVKATYGERWRTEAGGLSGDDAGFRALSTKMISFMYRQTNGKMPVIGVGGVKDVATAVEKFKAGASAVQLLTALNFKGPSLPGDINEGLVAYLEQEGLREISEIVGSGS